MPPRNPKAAVATCRLPSFRAAILQERFRRYHELADAQGGKSQIDLLVEQLAGLHKSLLDEQNFEQAAQARQNMQSFLSALSTSASRLEPPFAGMFKTAMAKFQQKIIGEKAARDIEG